MQNGYKEHLDNEALRVLGSPNVRKNLDQDTLAMISNGGIVLEDAVFYLKKNITANPLDLIVRSESEKVGTRNIDRAVLPNLQHLVLKKIELEYAMHATETDPAVVTYSSKKPSTPVSALENGELVIEQDGKPLISIPISQFFQAADVDDNSKKGFWLDNWRVIKAEQPITVQIKYAEGQAMQTAAEQHHVSVKLIGTKTRKA